MHLPRKRKQFFKHFITTKKEQLQNIQTCKTVFGGETVILLDIAAN